MNKRDHFKHIFIVHETVWILSSLTGIFKFIYLLSRKNLFRSCFALKAFTFTIQKSVYSIKILKQIFKCLARIL